METLIIGQENVPRKKRVAVEVVLVIDVGKRGISYANAPLKLNKLREKLAIYL